MAEQQHATTAAVADPFKDDPDALFTEQEAARFLNFSHRTLQGWRYARRARGEDKGPVAFEKDGEIRYRRRRLVEFIEAHERHGGYAQKAAQLERRVAELEAELARAAAPARQAS
jgi:hypothetical protein